MGSSTKNYALIKPSEDDYFNIEDFNKNVDIIDSELKSSSDKIEVLEKNLYNPNLLINSNFKVSNLVNQRGQTKYTGNGYQFDMWLFGGDASFTTDLTATYVKYTRTATGTYRNLVQYIENSNVESGYYTQSALIKGTAGKQISFTILVDGVYKPTLHISTGDWQLITNTVKVQDTLNSYTLQFQNLNELEIQYMKLERGEVATTFVDDDPATKLAKCQRYLQKHTGDFLGVVLGTTNCGLSMNLPTEMRAGASIISTVDEFRNSVLPNSFTINGVGRSQMSITGLQVAGSVISPRINMILENSTLTLGQVVQIYSTILLSAEL